MSTPVAEPDEEPVRGHDYVGDVAVGGTPLAVPSLWDPRDRVFDRTAVGALQGRLSELLAALTEERHTLESAGRDLGLTRRELPVDVPSGWAGGPGSPMQYMRAAEGYLYIAMDGRICVDAVPESPRAENPPPAGRFCCRHDAAHGGPHCIP